MFKISTGRPLFLALALTMLFGCNEGSDGDEKFLPPLSAENINLIFVVSPDLAYHAPGDVDKTTANLTSQGLQRSLLMASFLQQQVLGGKNVNGIYALQPMSHLQTTNNYPDMGALVSIQQFAMLNQITLPGNPGEPLYQANSYPINVSYTPGSVPSGVVEPLPLAPCPACQGLEFDDERGNNLALAKGLIKANAPGFYVFSAPWETISSLLAKIDVQQGYKLSLPRAYESPNHVYALSIKPSGQASLVTYNSKLNPPSTYPVLSPSPKTTACTAVPFSITATGGVDGVVIPEGTSTNETVYMVRHAEAHPEDGWDDGNFVAAGQWRALDLPNALRGKIAPDQVYSIDPAQVYPGALANPGLGSNWSYVRPSLTVVPYAIANKLPYHLIAGFLLAEPDSPLRTGEYFFRGGKFSNQTVLLAWEHDHIPPIVNKLLALYKYSGTPAPDWLDGDYDSIWTVKTDSKGNLSINNHLCEGIDSIALPFNAPPF